MKLGRLLALLLLLCFGQACGKETLEPVGSVALEPESLDLPFGEWAKMTLTWDMTSALEGLSGNLMVFVHLLDTEGEVQMTLDHPFPGNWEPGASTDDPVVFYHSSLGYKLAPGEYRLTVGLYDTESGRRFALEGGTDVHRQEYEIGAVVVPETEAQVPTYEFSEAWRPVEPGRDRQVLGRRWLVGSGEVVIGPTQESGQVSMLFKVPQAGEGLQLAFENPDEGDGNPRIDLTSSCGVTAELVGSGLHAFEVPLAAAEICTLQLVPNYQLIDLESFNRSTLTLEQLGWQPQR